LTNWNWDDVIVISSDDEYDEEEQIPMPTVESRVVVVGRKRVYSLIDESESDEEKNLCSLLFVKPSCLTRFTNYVFVSLVYCPIKN
jgi:hypothetical protein